MALTRKEFRWLATEIAPMTNNPEAFISKVKAFNTNRNFCSYKFTSAVYDAFADKESQECGPDLYKQADY